LSAGKSRTNRKSFLNSGAAGVVVVVLITVCCSFTLYCTLIYEQFFVSGVVPKRSGQVQANSHQTGRGLGTAGTAVHKAGQELFGKFDGLDRHRGSHVPPAAAAATTAATAPRHADEPQELFEHFVAHGVWVVKELNIYVFTIVHIVV
jgi:hypothetical protein